MKDKLPPSSPECERGLIGSLLLDPVTNMPEVQARVPTGEIFYDLRHRAVYECLCDLQNEQEPIDVIIVQARLRAFGQIDAIGGAAYLSSLADEVPSGANCMFYLSVVLECFQLRKLLQVATNFIAKVYERDGTVTEILDDWEKEALKVRIHEHGGFTNSKAAADEALGMIEMMYERKGALIGVASGLPDLDRITGGLKGGEMIVIAGLSSHGKTSLGFTIVEAVAVDQRLPVGCFSLEMSQSSLLLRMLCSRARLNIKNVRDGFLAERDMPNIKKAHMEIRSAPLYIDAGFGQSITQISAKARRLHQQAAIKMLVIDYLQLIKPQSQKGENRQVEVSNISNGIKRLAGELNIPVLVMVQMNSNIEKEKHRKPRLSDLRESAAIGHDADLCLSLYAPTQDAEDNEDDGIPMNLRITKNRNGPANIDIKLLFQKAFTRFVSASKVTEADVPDQSTLGYNSPHPSDA